MTRLLGCRVTFCKELIYHALFPLSLPLIYFFEGGTAGILNRQYWGSRMAIMQWILGISCECPLPKSEHLLESVPSFFEKQLLPDSFMVEEAGMLLDLVNMWHHWCSLCDEWPYPILCQPGHCHHQRS